MSKITVLPTELRNRIAAGEVVERPASVVKELLENSIDAEAAVIDVEALRGGRKVLKVADDGAGMDREDALLCLERHATSKLLSESDLFRITTMGFRGEALPSIASVSRLTLTTAPRGAALGVTLTAEGGRVVQVRESPARGTTVEVRDLFFNTPARKKFLKRESTELLHIVEAVTRASLSHPGIGFTLTTDREETMNLPRASGIRERLIQVYGGEFMEGLREVEFETGGFKLHAFVSRPDSLRETKSHQLLFINRRPVRDPSISHALYAAYEGMLPRDKHPIYFIFLELDPSGVDFNVHPAKREVRFADREFVYRHVRRCVSDAMGRGLGEEDAERERPEDRPHGDAPRPHMTGEYPSPGLVPHGVVSEALSLGWRAEAPFIYLGETFLALSPGGGLTLIDHHAAHERVLYERLLRRVEIKGRMLLFPRQVRLSRKEHMVLLEQREMLFEFGIEVEDFGHDTVLARSLPEELDEADMRGILSDVAEEMMAGERPGRRLREAVAARIACHNSIRGKTVLNHEELAALLADLDKTDDPEHCPHGRPTRVVYTIEELKKLFKRK